MGPNSDKLSEIFCVYSFFEFKVEKSGIINAGVGKIIFDASRWLIRTYDAAGPPHLP
jgi:hypothetical protein